MTHGGDVVGERLALMQDGERFFLDALDAVADAGLGRPSPLPGWSRAHVVAHVARNADALVNLLHWARTGEETPMYTTPGQRDADIDSGARQPASELRHDVRDASARLVSAAEELPAEAWTAEVRTARGRTVAAAEVLWMRCREAWIHAVDLDAGVSCSDFPPHLVDLLLEEVAPSFAGRAECPRVTLRVTGTDRAWEVGSTGTGCEVSGEAAVLLCWLLGRGAGDGLEAAPGGRPLPSLPPWL